MRIFLCLHFSETNRARIDTSRRKGACLRMATPVYDVGHSFRRALLEYPLQPQSHGAHIRDLVAELEGLRPALMDLVSRRAFRLLPLQGSHAEKLLARDALMSQVSGLYRDSILSEMLHFLDGVLGIVHEDEVDESAGLQESGLAKAIDDRSRSPDLVIDSRRITRPPNPKNPRVEQQPAAVPRTAGSDSASLPMGASAQPGGEPDALAQRSRRAGGVAGRRDSLWRKALPALLILAGAGLALGAAVRLGWGPFGGRAQEELSLSAQQQELLQAKAKELCELRPPSLQNSKQPDPALVQRITVTGGLTQQRKTFTVLVNGQSSPEAMLRERLNPTGSQGRDALGALIAWSYREPRIGPGATATSTAATQPQNPSTSRGPGGLRQLLGFSLPSWLSLGGLAAALQPPPAAAPELCLELQRALKEQWRLALDTRPPQASPRSDPSPPPPLAPQNAPPQPGSGQPRKAGRPTVTPEPWPGEGSPQPRPQPEKRLGPSPAASWELGTPSPR